MRDVENWWRENKIAMRFEQIVVANNLLYGRSARRNAAHNVKLDGRPSARDANSARLFFERSKRKMKRNDYRMENEMRC
jgi:hypothetical protein